jgi:uncharacterized protein YjaZ
MQKGFIFSALLFTLLISIDNYSQSIFSNDPLEAKFITDDVDRFWKAFDQMGTSKVNPFNEYVEKGSPGVKGFIEGRIINADSMYQMVARRKKDYEKSRTILSDLESKKKKIRAIYSAMKYWYPDCKFPPIYFVIGRFNTGGTISEDGLLLGTEMLNDLNGLPGLVAHELIHFQQEIFGDNSLLKESIMEGSADFLGELISGEYINPRAFEYGEKHLEQLTEEFVLRMIQEDIFDWLYGTTGKDDRPNDLGYWMGYKITEAYFYKQEDKHKAVYNIINIKDPVSFLQESAYLDDQINKLVQSSGKKKGDFFRKYSEETYEVTFKVIVPDSIDDVYITGNQPELANWNPNELVMKKTSDFEREIILKIHTPAQFKFTRGGWEKEAFIDEIKGIPNLVIDINNETELEYRVLSWKDKMTLEEIELKMK